KTLPSASTAGPSRKHTPAAAVTWAPGATRPGGSGAFDNSAGSWARSHSGELPTRTARSTEATRERMVQTSRGTPPGHNLTHGPVLGHRRGADTSTKAAGGGDTPPPRSHAFDFRAAALYPPKEEGEAHAPSPGPPAGERRHAPPVAAAGRGRPA